MYRRVGGRTQTEIRGRTVDSLFYSTVSYGSQNTCSKDINFVYTTFAHRLFVYNIFAHETFAHTTFVHMAFFTAYSLAGH